MFDALRDIWEGMMRHRLRTMLTALSVAWGVFMLVILLGFGFGLQNSFQSKFSDDATNSIKLHRGKTSMPYLGSGPGRQIEFNNRDYDAIKKLEGVEYLTGRFYLRGEYTVSYKKQRSGFDIRAVHPDHLHLERTIITDGRYINEDDIRDKRKIAVIGKDVADFLFKQDDPIGAYIEVGKSTYRVVGIFVDEGREGEQKKIFIPVTTAQRALNAADDLHGLMFTVGDATLEESESILAEVKTLMAERKRYNPNDPRALRIRNNVEEFQKIMKIFKLIQAVIWIVGIGTLIAGVVGVSNIMIINVAERRREIGIRKALGATPYSITTAIVFEAVALTAFAGYLGIISGVGVLELASWLLKEADHIKNPQVDLNIILAATGMLVFFGACAGYVPARRASRIRPIEALRSE